MRSEHDIVVGGMSTGFSNIKSVLETSCRMIGRCVKGFEIIVVELNLGAFGNLISKAEKYIGYFLITWDIRCLRP